MTESVTRLSQGPPGWCRAAFCVVVLAALPGGGALVGCAAPAAPLEAVPPHAPVVADPARLSDARHAFRPGAPAADSFAAAAFRAAGLTPPFERRFQVGGAGRSLVAGLVPGGNPQHRDSLVVVAGVGPDGAAALLEAARMLATRSAYVVGPSRSLLVAIAFTGSPATPQSVATQAVARILGAPIWESEAVVALVVVGDGASSVMPAAADRGLTAVAVEPAAKADLPALAVSAFEAMVTAARPASAPLVSVTDSTTTR